jgi:multiple antibiotic resistance protein
METITHTTIAMLAVINPFVCGAMLLQAEQGKNTKQSIMDGLKAMLVVLIILLLSAFGGRYVLSAFGISMDAFKIVGGVILTFIGFQMFSLHKAAGNAEDKQVGLSKLIMFAASPGTISMVITLAAVHNEDGLPISAMAGTALAVTITSLIIVIMLRVKTKATSTGQGMMSKFMGLIIVAMGLQFMLDGIKHFFGV